MGILWRVRVWLRRLLGRYPDMDKIEVRGVDRDGDPCSPESSGGMPS